MDISLFFTILLLLPVFLLLTIWKRRSSSKRLPPGSLGIPIVGQSLGILRALQSNTAEEWIENRIKKYGPISKLSLFGTPTVLIHGQAANKFIFTCDSGTLGNQQPQTVKKLLGYRNLFELSGEDHKRVRGALMSFLKPDVLKQYVGKMDGEVREHLQMHWHGKQNVTVLPLMKTMTFNIICSLIIGVEPGAQREKFVQYFQQMMEGMLSLPVDIPFTRFSRSIKATQRIQNMLVEILKEKRVALENCKAHSHQDLITYMLTIQGDNNQDAAVISDNEIVHNVTLIMVAGHDTSSILITFFLRLLANDPVVYAAVLQEQEEIAKNKLSGEFLTWEDLSKMKYTWSVAMEVLRITPPVFGGFRKALKDIEYGGYLIPKGWQVFWASNMTHMNDSIFPESSKFDPSRFNNQASVPPYCFVAFGGGARICPGYEFARIETLVAIHYLVTRFTWKLCCTDNKFSRFPMPTPTQGLPIQIEPRKIM